MVISKAYSLLRIKSVFHRILYKQNRREWFAGMKSTNGCEGRKIMKMRNESMECTSKIACNAIEQSSFAWIMRFDLSILMCKQSVIFSNTLCCVAWRCYVTRLCHSMGKALPNWFCFQFTFRQLDEQCVIGLASETMDLFTRARWPKSLSKNLDQPNNDDDGESLNFSS